MVLEMFQTQTRNLLEEMFFQKHELMQVVYSCLWEAGIPLGFSLITALESYAMRHFAGKT